MACSNLVLTARRWCLVLLCGLRVRQIGPVPVRFEETVIVIEDEAEQFRRTEDVQRFTNFLSGRLMRTDDHDEPIHTPPHHQTVRREDEGCGIQNNPFIVTPGLVEMIRKSGRFDEFVWYVQSASGCDTGEVSSRT